MTAPGPGALPSSRVSGISQKINWDRANKRDPAGRGDVAERLKAAVC